VARAIEEAAAAVVCYAAIGQRTLAGGADRRAYAELRSRRLGAYPIVAVRAAAAHAPATDLPVRLAWAGLHFPETGERQDHGGEKNKAISRCVLHRAPPWVRARREHHRASASCFLRSRVRAGTSRGRESASRGVIVKGGDRRAGLRPNFCIDGGDCAQL